MEGAQTKHKIVKNIILFSASTATSTLISSIIKAAIPGKIGPEEFGRYFYVESISISLFAITTLGIDNLTRNAGKKEENWLLKIHSEALSLRITLCAIIILGALLLLPENTHEILLPLLLWQFFFTQNSILSSLLHRNEKILHTSLANTISKISTIPVLLVFWSKIKTSGDVALLILIFEIIKTVIIVFTVQRTGTEAAYSPTIPAKRTIIKLSPFFLQHTSQQIYARLGIILIPILSNDVEAGWYGGGSNVVLLGLLFAPSINAVIAPMVSKSTNENDRKKIIRNSNSYIIPILSIIAVCLFSFSSEIVSLVFGKNFINSSLPLKAMAPSIPLTYLSIIHSIDIINQKKTWLLVRITLYSIPISAFLIVLLIPTFHSFNQPGLAAAAAATSGFLSEFFVIKKMSSISMVTIDRITKITTIKAIIITILLCAFLQITS